MRVCVYVCVCVHISAVALLSFFLRGIVCVSVASQVTTINGATRLRLLPPAALCLPLLKRLPPPPHATAGVAMRRKPGGGRRSMCVSLCGTVCVSA
ncbi:MAG: hypothetical protein P4L40_25375 [Terracidiphilus sp.]|nr:hypothetical protein [Terracidiphilus sp.]